MVVTQQPTKKSKLTWYILIAMVLGIIVGYLVHNNYPPESRKVFADNVPNIDLTQNFTCQSCDSSMEMEVPFTVDFFWSGR